MLSRNTPDESVHTERITTRRVTVQRIKLCAVADMFVVLQRNTIIIVCFMSVPDFIFYITSLLYVGDLLCVAG